MNHVFFGGERVAPSNRAKAIEPHLFCYEVDISLLRFFITSDIYMGLGPLDMKVGVQVADLQRGSRAFNA